MLEMDDGFGYVREYSDTSQSKIAKQIKPSIATNDMLIKHKSKSTYYYSPKLTVEKMPGKASGYKIHKENISKNFESLSPEDFEKRKTQIAQFLGYQS